MIKIKLDLDNICVRELRRRDKNNMSDEKQKKYSTWKKTAFCLYSTCTIMDILLGIQ